MTVIREKQNYNYPKPNLGTSDTESLHLESASASDTESLNEEPSFSNRRRGNRPPVKISHSEELVNIKKSCGKKKLRRYQNRCQLYTLNEENENENVIVIMESYKSPFARLLENPNALEYWNEFIEKSEEEQIEIVNSFTEKLYDKDQIVPNDNKHGRLSSRIVRTIKIKKNLSIEAVEELEKHLIDFFKAQPQGVYIKFPCSSFDRLLLHAIAQYHKLKSSSVPVEDIGKRSVEVHNSHTNWRPADCLLTDFVKELRR